uniref:Uncharacterized protein n=1 Tax=Musca domestica TaxID=7370 RepID=A0A1I8NJK6_MUSDO
MNFLQFFMAISLSALASCEVSRAYLPVSNREMPLSDEAVGDLMATESNNLPPPKTNDLNSPEVRLFPPLTRQDRTFNHHNYYQQQLHQQQQQHQQLLQNLGGGGFYYQKYYGVVPLRAIYLDRSGGYGNKLGNGGIQELANGVYVFKPLANSIFEGVPVGNGKGYVFDKKY